MKKSPTVLLSIFPSFRIGGAQIRFVAVANQLGRAFRHVIVSMDGAEDCQSQLDKNLDVTFLQVVNKRQDSLGNRKRFRAVLRSLKPDVLVTHNWGSIDWSIANWPPLARHIHIEDGFGPEEANRQLPRRAWTRRLVLRGSVVIVPSRSLQKIALDEWKLNAKKVRYIPNGIDIARFSAASIEPLFPRTMTPVIGTVAVLRREKNLLRLMDVFQAVRSRGPCRLVIAGDGPDRSAIVARAAALGLADDVLFTGYRADTERVYAALDVFVLTSDTEQMPTSVLESMAAGLPIVSTEVGDVRQMVSAENRPFIVEKSTDALTGGILKMLSEPEIRRMVGRANRAAAARDFSQEIMFAAYGALLRPRG